jgi:hypothetical protein
MYLIQQVTTDALQKQTLNLPDGTQVSITLQFVPMQFGWFIRTLTYGTFTLTGLRVTNSPNMLNQFRNQLPFGLACYSQGNREPSQQQDFSSGASKIYVLTQAETAAYAELLTR